MDPRLTLDRDPARVILKGLGFRSPAAICGFNAVKPKSGSVVVLEARPVRLKGTQGSASLRFCHRKHPLLVVAERDSGDRRLRSAALATDLAPHWCAGLVDWGGRHRKLTVTDGQAVEVGCDYIRFVTQLVDWTAGHR